MGGEYAAHVGILLYLFFFFVREQHYLGRCVCSPFFRPIICSKGFCVGCSLVDLSLYARSETFSRGFFPLPIGQKEEWDANSNRTHNTHASSSGEEHKKRTLSPLCKRTPSATTQHVVQSVQDEDVQKHRVIILAFYRKTERDESDTKKKDLIICLGFVNVALSFGVFLYVSKSLLKDSILFESPPFSTQTCRGVESIKQTPEDFIEW